MSRTATAHAPSSSQPILVECPCGAKYEVGTEHAGERFQCEKEGCGKVLMVPEAHWGQQYAIIVKKLESPSERVREQACLDLVALGGPGAVTALMRGVYDPSRSVVNIALKCMLMLGEPGQKHLLKLMREGALRMSRLVAMVRELEWWEGAALYCDLIDAGLLNEGQISETITLLGEAKQRRCISTLSNLRRAYPNLAMLVDNALANYRHLDSQVNRIPDDAKNTAGGEVDALEMGALHRTGKSKAFGCMPVLVAMIAIPAALVVWQVVG